MSNKKYTSIKNDYALSLDISTLIIEAPDDGSIECNTGDFTRLDKIGECSVGTLIDVLGAVRSPTETIAVTLRDGVQAHKRSLTLVDESSYTVEVTLWRQFADVPLQENQIIGIKGARVTEYNGRQLNTINDSSILQWPLAAACDSWLG